MADETVTEEQVEPASTPRSKVLKQLPPIGQRPKPIDNKDGTFTHTQYLQNHDGTISEFRVILREAKRASS